MLPGLFTLFLLLIPVPGQTAAAPPAPPLVTPLAGAVRLDWHGGIPIEGGAPAALRGLGAAAPPLGEIGGARPPAPPGGPRGAGGGPPRPPNTPLGRRPPPGGPPP